MKIFCIGTTSYKNMMHDYASNMETKGHRVRIPKFDDYDLDELQICLSNIENIKWADEVHIFWDQRSVGTVFDFGACMALEKKVKIVFMNHKTFANVMRWYEDPGIYDNETRWCKQSGPGSEAPF